MATRVAIASAAFSVSTTWGQVTNTPTIHATTNLSATGSIYSAAFQANSTDDYCIGCLIYVTTTPVTYDYTLTLQDNSSGYVDTAATVNVAAADFPTVNNWIFFKFASPYKFTSTAANYYRFKLTSGGASGTLLRVAQSTTASAFAYMAVDDRDVVPSATENIWIVGANGATTIEVTMDGTQSVGAGTDTAVPTFRTYGNSVNVCWGGLLNWDIVASATLTTLGHIVVHSGGELLIGTVAVPYPAANIAKIRFNENGTSCNYGMTPFGTGKIIMQGAPKSSTSLWKTKYVSGAGTAADPMIVNSDVAWSVNDEIIVGASQDGATNYAESEKKFIKTVVGDDTYVISDTAGGAEAALTYTHNTDSWVLNVERNIIVDSTAAAYGWYFYHTTNTPGNLNFDWCRFETLGRNTTNKYGFQLVQQLNTYIECDYCVAYRGLQYGFSATTSKVAMSFTGLISCYTSSTGTYGMYLYPTNTTFTDCFSINCYNVGMATLGVGNTFTRCYAISCGTGAENEGFYLGSNIGCVFNDCESHCNSGNGMNGVNSLTNLEFYGCLFGTKGNNLVDFVLPADYFFSMKFMSCYFNDDPPFTGYLDFLPGSEICFDTLNGVANQHFWYTNLGSAQSTGAAPLTDTTVRTPGSLGVRLSPEEATDGFTWEFSIFCKASSICNFFGYFKKNATFSTDVAKVELWLPSSTAADDTFTLADNTNWQACVLSSSYTGTVDRLATIKVVGITATASAYLYCDDFFNAGDTVASYDKVTGLDTWNKGKPVDIISSQQVSAADIWTFPTADLTTADTTGKTLVDAKKKAALAATLALM